MILYSETNKSKTSTPTHIFWLKQLRHCKECLCSFCCTKMLSLNKKKPYIHACIKMNSLLTFKFTWHSIMNIASSLLSGHLYFYKKDNHEGMQVAEYSSDLGSPEKGWSKCFIYYSTTYVNVNCADKFYTLRHKIVGRVYTILLSTQSKKRRNSSAFVIHCYKFRLYYIVV